MKSYEEVTNDLLERRDRYVARQKENRRKLTVLASSLGCFALVAVLGLGLGQDASYSGQIPATEPKDDVIAAGENGEGVFAGNYWVPEDPSTEPGQEQCATSNPTEDVTEPFVEPPVDPTVESGIVDAPNEWMGSVTIDGVWYLQWNLGEQTYTPGECLGSVTDFEGSYKQFCPDLAAKLYVSKEDPDVLVVVFEAGGSLLLARNPSDLWP